MGGPGQGQGGTPEYGAVDPSARVERAHTKVDPKGKMSVTTFRGIPKPGELTPEVRAALRAAREDARAPLESDQIPRRYRDGIRSWFDGLEEQK